MRDLMPSLATRRGKCFVAIPDGPWAGFARESVTDWLALLTASRPAAGPGEPTMVLAVLRGALLDLLATGDLERTMAAVRASVSSLSR